MPGSMLSTSAAYITVRSPPFFASLGGVLLCAGFSELELSSPPQPATNSASAAATANMARHCAANLICTYPPIRMGRGLQPRSPPVAAERSGQIGPVVLRAHPGVCRLRLEDHVLGALPQHQPPQLAQLLGALRHGEEVVAGQLPDDAGETRSAVREQDLRLAVAARVEQDLTGCRVARVVLETEPRLEVPERYPC